MPSSPRGHALIINNTEFSDELVPRTGAYLDSICLDLLANDLKFEVIHFPNLDYKASLSLFEKESKFDHSDFDCFILVYMSHGLNEGVCSSDGKIMDIADIMAYFDGKKCPSLAGKPKIFLFRVF
ncbi:hypothetical protein ScPMuIL_007581 [Solemya velum]